MFKLITYNRHAQNFPPLEGCPRSGRGGDFATIFYLKSNEILVIK
jgi:hypothetical protein